MSDLGYEPTYLLDYGDFRGSLSQILQMIANVNKKDIHSVEIRDFRY